MVLCCNMLCRTSASDFSDESNGHGARLEQIIFRNYDTVNCDHYASYCIQLFTSCVFPFLCLQKTTTCPPHPNIFPHSPSICTRKMATAKCDIFVDLITQRASLNYLVFKIVHTRQRPNWHTQQSGMWLRSTPPHSQQFVKSQKFVLCMHVSF